MRSFNFFFAVFSLVIFLGSCGKKDDPIVIVNPDTAAKVSVDRFSAGAGSLQVRTSSNGLPAANAPVNFDQGVFITVGLGPQGQHINIIILMFSLPNRLQSGFSSVTANLHQ